jgi:hypothetical protein
MSRPLEHEDVVCFRLSSAMHQTLETAVAALGTTKSQLVRAIVVQALRHEDFYATASPMRVGSAASRTA